MEVHVTKKAIASAKTPTLFCTSNVCLSKGTVDTSSVLNSGEEVSNRTGSRNQVVSSCAPWSTTILPRRPAPRPPGGDVDCKDQPPRRIKTALTRESFAPDSGPSTTETQTRRRKTHHVWRGRNGPRWLGARSDMLKERRRPQL